MRQAKTKIALILLLAFICVNSKSQKNAPDRLGDFIVGKTAFQDFWIKIEAYGLFGSTSLEISSLEELSGYMIAPDVQDNFSSMIYEIEDNVDDTTAAWLTWVPASDSMRVFFAPQIKIETLTVNNATFRFLNDTLFSHIIRLLI
jgi:hypothetical protein